jgi:hypothetical protein
MNRFLLHTIKLTLCVILLLSSLLLLNKYEIPEKRDLFILINPKRYESISNLKIHQKKKEISIIGTSRTAGFEKEMFLNESFYNYSMIVNSITDIKNLVLDLNLEKGDTIVLGLDQWNFNSLYPPRNTNIYKKNNLHFPYMFFEGRKETSSYILYGDKAIDNFSGFKNDGSYFYGKRYIVPKEELEDYNFFDTYSRIKNGNRRFEYGSNVDIKQIEILEELLIHLKTNEINLISFFPPFAPSVYDMMNNKNYDYSYIKKSSSILNRLFDNYGFVFKDFSRIVSYDNSFYLDGFHCNRNVYFHMLKELGVSVNPYFKNEFELSEEESNFLIDYFSNSKK